MGPTPSAGTLLRRTATARPSPPRASTFRQPHAGTQGSLSYSSEGRVNDLIDRGGEKVNVEEVELLVAGNPAVAEMALVGMPDPRLEERGCAYVVPRDPQNPPTLADIYAYLEAEGLAEYKWPERLELIDTLPRTQIGKVFR